MEETRTLKTLAFTAFVIAVGGLTLGYAAMSQSLTISSTATVQNSSASWNVGFNTSVKTCTKTGDAVAGTPTVTANSVSVSGIVLKAPGDTATCTFQVKNSGNLDAQIDSWTATTATVTSNASDSTTKTADETLVKNNYSCTWTYAAGSFTKGTALLSNGTAEVKLVCSLKSTMDTLPTGTVSIGSVGGTLAFTQKNK